MDDLQCDLCKSNDEVKQYALTINGEKLQITALLCREHGEHFIHRHGILLTSLTRSIAEVFVKTK